MDLVLTPKAACPTCGLERSESINDTCMPCRGIRRDILSKNLGYLKHYAFNQISSVEDLKSHGKNFIGWIRAEDEKRLEEISVNELDLRDTCYGRMTLPEFVSKYGKKTMDKFLLYRYILHGLGFYAQYLPFDNFELKPRQLSAPVEYDMGDKKIAEFYLTRNGQFDAMETSRQTVNKILYDRELAKLMTAFDDGCRDIRRAEDLFEAAQRNNDWWSADLFAKFFKHVGRLDMHTIAEELKLRNWTPNVKRLVSKVNNKHHM